MADYEIKTRAISDDGTTEFYTAEEVKGEAGIWSRSRIKVTATPPRWDRWSDEAVGSRMNWSAYGDRDMETVDEFMAVMSAARTWLAEQPEAVRPDAWYAERAERKAELDRKIAALEIVRANCPKCQRAKARAEAMAAKRREQGKKSLFRARNCPDHETVGQLVEA